MIDADYLKEKKVYSQERHEYIIPVCEIDWMPTVEPKQGEWIETTHAIVCSNCGHNIEPRQFGSYMRYCCVCGSDNLKEGDEK